MRGLSESARQHEFMTSVLARTDGPIDDPRDPTTIDRVSHWPKTINKTDYPNALEELVYLVSAVFSGLNVNNTWITFLIHI